MMDEIPDVGHVIKYSYLWWNEHRKGREEGMKDRPSCVILNRKTTDGDTMLYVLAITHTRPEKSEYGVEIPLATKKRLGLDDAPSWVITTEFNKFIWPGYDIRRVSSGGYSYGILPEKLISQIIESFTFHARDARLKAVARE